MLTYQEDKIIMILDVYAGNFKENLINSQLTYSVIDKQNIQKLVQSIWRPPLLTRFNY